jgi:hypothetical protein
VRESQLEAETHVACKNGVIGIKLNQMRTSMFQSYVMQKQVRERTRNPARPAYSW